MRNFAKFTRIYLCRSLFFDKVRRCKSATSLKSLDSRVGAFLWILPNFTLQARQWNIYWREAGVVPEMSKRGDVNLAKCGILYNYNCIIILAKRGDRKHYTAAMHLYWNHTSAWAFSCKLAAQFSELHFRGTSLEDCIRVCMIYNKNMCSLVWAKIKFSV